MQKKFLVPKTIHGISPSQVREGDASLKAFPPLVFQMTVRGTQEMNYRIEKKDAINKLIRSELGQ